MTFVSSHDPVCDFVTLEHLPATGEVHLDLPNDTDPNILQQELQRIRSIRLHFPSFADGRAFSQARCLRNMGFRGMIRATGHLIPDQQSFAKQCGIDTFDLAEDLRARTTERAWQKHTATPDYRAHLSGGDA